MQMHIKKIVEAKTKKGENISFQNFILSNSPELQQHLGIKPEELKTSQTNAKTTKDEQQEVFAPV